MQNSNNVNKLAHTQVSNPAKSPDSTVMSADQLRTILAEVVKGFQAQNRKMLQSESRKLTQQN